MTPQEALQRVKGYAGANRVIIEGHADLRMRQRGVSYPDLRSALMNGVQCVAGEDERWKVTGPDLDGDDLTVVVVVEDGVIVVTVF